MTFWETILMGVVLLIVWGLGLAIGYLYGLNKKN